MSESSELQLKNSKVSEVIAQLPRNGGGSSSEPIKPTELVSILFEKAPFHFLRRRNANELANAAHIVGSALKDVITNVSSISVKHVIDKSSCRCAVALKDCPFIVSTLRDTAEALGLTIEVLLHPVVTLNGTNYSITYIEVDGADSENFPVTILESLKDVILATEDYPLMQSETLAFNKLISLQALSKSFPHSENVQAQSFLEWLSGGMMVCAGVSRWAIATEIEVLSRFGIFKTESHIKETLLSEVKSDVSLFKEMNEPLWITRLTPACFAHHGIRFLHCMFRSKTDTVDEVLSVVGIFTAKALAAPATSVPLIRTKLDLLLSEERLTKGSYDYKVLVDTIDRMPKEEVIRLPLGALRDIFSQLSDPSTENDLQITVHSDTSQRGALVVVAVGQESATEENRLIIQSKVESLFHVPLGSSEYQRDFSAYGVTRYYFHIRESATLPSQAEVLSLREQLSAATKSWKERLNDALELFEDGDRLIREYVPSISANYQALTEVDEAIRDIFAVQSISPTTPIRVMLSKESRTSSEEARVDIYHYGATLSLSNVLPVLEHAGFFITSELSTSLTLSTGATVYVHRFLVHPRFGQTITHATFDDCVAPGLERVLLGMAEDDVLNSLMLSAHLNIKCIAALRTYCALLWQYNAFPRKHQIREALASNPQAALKIWGLFEARFNPIRTWTQSQRDDECSKIRQQLDDILRSENDIIKDRMIRSICAIVMATVRTNFFTDADIVALKVATRTLEFAPNPKPLFEIFMHGQTLEGVHLRMNSVSRGGIRWSERPDDFRTEVLGLVRTQQIKNVFIVPQGAKGGFVIRGSLSDGETLQSKVKETYSLFISTLLSLADNRKGDAVIHPSGLIIYDEPDPYFVVAADKGTATFSDTANELAQKRFEFWLDDAFASGGSNGYDHKKYGITAKGAWECVVRHFCDLGIDYLNVPFSAVGIGDMAGDVFGNGLILSDKVKLIGAFNHKHIFLDPNPDPAVSFAERKRLFDMGRSQWSDYNSKLISAGGGIFDRASKSIKLSSQARAALGVGQEVPDEVPGEELISLILKAPVDLFWNGGIGTYVKSSSETNADVNDSANDRVRVSANELRCKIIGEGGNLGLTQRARVEFSLLGGRVNTDAVDNSGGVGLSDREVNLKILFASLLQSKKLSREERNIILSEVADEVCEKVLQHNRNHAYRLTSSSTRSVVQHEYFKIFLAHLARLGLINRNADVLPDDETIHERLATKQGLLRPELSICMAASKMWIRQSISGTAVLNERCATSYLLDYFPNKVVARFRDEALTHPLKDHITSCSITNTIIDIFGISFPYRVSQNHSAGIPESVAACLAVLDLFDGKAVIAALASLDTSSTSQAYLRLRGIVEQGLRDGVVWLLSNAARTSSADAIIDRYIGKFGGTLLESFAFLDDVLGQDAEALGNDLYKRLNTIAQSPIVFDLLELRESSSLDERTIFGIHTEVSKQVGLSELTASAKLLPPQNRAEYTLLRRSVTDARRAVRLITRSTLQSGVCDVESARDFLNSQSGFAVISSAAQELNNLPGGVANIALASRQLCEFAAQIGRPI